jgi:hypothetical protein
MHELLAVVGMLLGLAGDDRWERREAREPDRVMQSAPGSDDGGAVKTDGGGGQPPPPPR